MEMKIVKVPIRFTGTLDVEIAADIPPELQQSVAAGIARAWSRTYFADDLTTRVRMPSMALSDEAVALKQTHPELSAPDCWRMMSRGRPQVIELRTECLFDRISVDWTIHDVKSVAKLTDAEAYEVLLEAKHDHDASMGISWQTLENIADRLFPGSVAARVGEEDEADGYDDNDPA